MLSEFDTTLNKLAASAAVVVRLDLPAAEAQRLKALGVFEGQHIVLQKSGDPMIFSAAGARIAIAREVAAGIVVCVERDCAA